MGAKEFCVCQRIYKIDPFMFVKSFLKRSETKFCHFISQESFIT